MQKHKVKIIRLIIGLFLAILTVSVYFIFFHKNKEAAAWWNDTWGYRKPIELTNSTGTDLTDYQVAVTIDTATLITDGKMQSSCQDMRFTDKNGKEIPYWIENCNSATSKTWLKVPTLYNGTDATTVYFYYGNPNATDKSSTTDTFIREISGLQGAWNMDEASWTNDCSTESVLDSSGNSNNGTACPNTTGPVGGATGIFDNAGSFDGSDDYVNAGSIDYSSFSGLTISAWFKANALTQHTLASSWGDDVNSNYAWLLFAGWWEDSKFDWLTSSNGTSYDSLRSNSSLSTGAWHHIVATWEPTRKYIYVDGALDASQTSGVATSIKNNDFATLVGCDSDGGAESKMRFFDGQIDDVQIFNYALTEEQVKQLYNEGGAVRFK